MAFKIQPHGKVQYPGQYADTRDIWHWLQDLTRQCGETFHWVKSRLPENLHGEYGPIPLTDGRTTVLRVDFGNHGRDARRKSSKHRVFAVCPDCKAEVPAGRVHQHKCKEQ